MLCPDEIIVCITRGSFWPLNILLGRNEFQEVESAPTQYRCRITFRVFQDDSSPNLFSVIAVPEVLPDALPMEANILISFGLEGSVTQTLPDYDIVGFCEIYEAVNPSNPTRLFNMKVKIND
jgi:hypothetical protein